MRYVVYVTETRNAYNGFVGKFHGKITWKTGRKEEGDTKRNGSVSYEL